MAPKLDMAVVATLIKLIQLAADTKSQDLKALDLSPSASAIQDCEEVKFYLATKDDPNGESKACLNQTTPLFNGQLDPSKLTIVLAHGWHNNETTDFTANITRSFLNLYNVNIVQVDWSAIAMKDYITARSKVPDVGLTVAAFIKRLIQELKVKLSDLHLVGHSLGAHIVGIAGRQFQSPNKIGNVTGLDPAGPLFWTTMNDGMISIESGEFVVILHTNPGLLGTTKELGHADFYANGETPFQPGCKFDPRTLLGSCSHSKAISYFTLAIQYPKAFCATRCDSYSSFETSSCEDNDHVYFNYNIPRNASGKFCFNTTSSNR